MRKIIPLFILNIILSGCGTKETEKEVYRSEALAILQVSEHVYTHISYLDTEGFGRAACNGMIVCNENEVVVFDTACDDVSSAELINWVSEILESEIIAVIPTHYHADNLGGLSGFHRRGIPSYALQKTIHITEEYGYPLPQHGFDPFLEMEVGGEKIIVDFLGEGHTCDNVIGYFPLENIMFGGCLIKGTGAGKGNLEEANTGEWSETVRRVRAKYPDTRKIIPGHGKSGGCELFDYTIELFAD